MNMNMPTSDTNVYHKCVQIEGYLRVDDYTILTH